MSPRFSLHGRIGDCTRELGANRTPQPSFPPPPSQKIKKNTVVIRLLKREYLPSEFKSDIVKVTNYRWKEIFSLLFKNPSRVIFFSMLEKDNFYQATCFFVYRLVFNGILAMVPESVEGVLQHHV